MPVNSLLRTMAVSAVLLWLAACSADDATAPSPVVELSKAGNPLADEVRRLTVARGITPLERPARVRRELVQLGRALAFDKILSGNRDISCMTCHLPAFG
ncbi:MAG: hypothetical protein M3477_09115, partial [Gemmatimonadota bacterium]|nr:hypothetical protein [Gemmatimonadota bacterium]